MERGGAHTDDGFAEMLEGLQRVGVEAARRADELDDLGTFPDDLFDDLVATECFQAMLPRAFGGRELSLAQINTLTVEAAKANGSLGWMLLIGIPSPLVLGLLPEETASKLVSEYPKVRSRGAIAPKGRAVPTGGGYVVSGQWPFASGGPHPDLVAANCVVTVDGAPQIGPDGMATMVLAVMRAAEVEFLDTWHVLGLRGTDSCDFALRDVFVPEHMTADLFSATNCFDTPITRLPLRVPLAFGHASVAIGIAEGALADLAELAQSKRAAMNPAALLADDPVFRHLLGEHALRLASVRALLDQQTEMAWQAGVAARPLSAREAVEGRTMAGYVTAECVKIVDSAYTLAGSASLYDTSSLQRRLRDMHAATQHIAATGDGYRLLGALLVGYQPSPLELF